MIVKLVGVPGQSVPPLELIGVTDIVAVIGLVLVLVAVKLMAPDPEALNPINGLELVQEKPVAFTPEKVIGPTADPSQKTLFVIGLIVGVGKKVTITVSVSKVQGPTGSSLVNVNVMVPTKFAGGVKVEVKEFGFENTPPFEEAQLPLEAAPPTVPFKVRIEFLHKGG